MRIRCARVLPLLSLGLLPGCSDAGKPADDVVASNREPIIGGTTVTAPDTSGVVHLSMSFTHNTATGPVTVGMICTGTLMTNAWVLTARHCLNQYEHNSVVYAGTPTRVEARHLGNAGHDLITVTNPALNTNYFLHPSLDAALVRLPNSFTVSGATDTIFNTVITQSASSTLAKRSLARDTGETRTRAAPACCGRPT